MRVVMLPIIMLALSIFLLISCTEQIEKPAPLSIIQSIKSSGKLKVLTRNAPTTYYEGSHGLAGIEYDLIKSFAKHLNVQPEFIIKDNTSDILRSLSNGESHIAAAGLTQTQSRSKNFSFGPVYQEVQQQLVCRRGSVLPKSTEDLIDTELWVAAATSYVDSLKKFQKILPELRWTETTEYDTEQLLEQVWQKKIPCTVADSNIVSINRRYYPEIVIAFNFNQPEPLAWLLPENTPDLQQALKVWFDQYKADGKLARTVERYYGFVDLFNYVDLQSFKKSMVKRLPKYKQHFQNAAEKNGLSWTLLAAQSYQESHWKSRAKSPTGVRGMMMLTLNTAKELGISNRINAKNSIFGGAKYMKKLRKRIPEQVSEPDRTWFALAAYNVGMGHIYDARSLAKKLKKNPNKWHDLASVLPLLSQKKYYKKLKYGYARGNEPVRYVKRIRDYHDILSREVAESDQSENTVSLMLETP